MKDMLVLMIVAIAAYVLLGAFVIPRVMCKFNNDEIAMKEWRKNVIIAVAVMAASVAVTALLFNVLSMVTVPLILIAGLWPVIKYWKTYGNEVREWIAFSFMSLAATVVAVTMTPHVVAAVAGLTADSAVVAGFISALPWAAFVVTIGWMAACGFSARAIDAETVEEADNENRHRRWAIIITAIAAAILLFAPVVVGLAGDKKADSTKKTDSATDSTAANVVGTKIQVPDWCHFYHHDVVKKDKTSLDYGPAAPTEAKKAEAELWTRLERDPALYAAIAGWTDANFGTSFLEGAPINAVKAQKGRALDIINIALREYVYNGDAAAQKSRAGRLKTFLKANGAATVATKAVKSQMYMTGYDGEVPVIVVAEGAKTNTKVLVFKITRGNQSGELWLKLDCGYQPCSKEAVSKQLNIESVEPSKYSNGYKYKPGGSPSKPSPGPSPSPSPSPGPGPGPTPTPPGYDKDPAKAPAQNTEPNDNPGPGPNTNNGVGSNYSAVDTPDSSSHETYNEYVEWNGNGGQMEVINDNQQTGGSGGNNPTNTPTYTPETPPAAVDNNGNNGVGWGGADDPTPATKPPITPPGEVGQPWTPNW